MKQRRNVVRGQHPVFVDSRSDQFVECVPRESLNFAEHRVLDGAGLGNDILSRLGFKVGVNLLR